MEPVFVSVIIPVYDDPDSLAGCLQCLHRQTYPAQYFEVLVIDNGSKRPIKPVVDAPANVRYLLEPQAGSYAARNLGVKEQYRVRPRQYIQFKSRFRA